MDQIGRTVELVREALGEDALGAYLHGSAVFGGLQPNSDLDVFAVSRRATTTHERRWLIEELMPISRGPGSEPGLRHIELTIVVQGDLRPWRYPPPLDFMYGDWWRAEYAAGDYSPWESPNPDVAIAVHQVLAADHPLFGPPPAELLDPVPFDDVRRAMVDGIPGLLADLDDDTANVLLTLARIWVTAETSRILPKHEAAAWVLERLAPEHRPVLDRARAVHLGSAEDQWEGAQEAADEVVRRVHRRLSRGAFIGEADRSR